MAAQKTSSGQHRRAVSCGSSSAVRIGGETDADDDEWVWARTARTAYNRVRAIHYVDVFFFFGGFFLSTVTAYLLSKANYHATASQCILGAGWLLVFPERNNTTIIGARSSVIRINFTYSTWGSDKKCNFVQFGHVASAIGGFILCWFFLLLKPYADAFNQRTGTSSAKLVPWAMLGALGFTAIALVASIDMSVGFSQWCNALVYKNAEIETCSDMSNYTMRESYESYSQGTNVYAMMLSAELCSWGGFGCWLSAFLTIFVRFVFHMDFPAFFFADSDSVTDAALVRGHSRTASSALRNPLLLPPLLEVASPSSSASSRKNSTSAK